MQSDNSAMEGEHYDNDLDTDVGLINLTWIIQDLGLFVNETSKIKRF